MGDLPASNLQKQGLQEPKRRRKSALNPDEVREGEALFSYAEDLVVQYLANLDVTDASLQHTRIGVSMPSKQAGCAGLGFGSALHVSISMLKSSITNMRSTLLLVAPQQLKQFTWSSRPSLALVRSPRVHSTYALATWQPSIATYLVNKILAIASIDTGTFNICIGSLAAMQRLT